MRERFVEKVCGGWEIKETTRPVEEAIDRRNLLFQRWSRSGQNNMCYVLQRREMKKAKNDW